MNQTVQKTFYAAVGAPVVVTRKGRERLHELRGRLNESTEGVTADARERFEEWAAEGEKFLTTLSEREELDQIQGQVHKLREQLEEIMAAWRESFRPAEEKQSVKVEVEEEAEEKAEEPAAEETPSAEKKTEEPAAKSETKKKDKDDEDNEAA